MPNNRSQHLKFISTGGSGEVGVQMLELSEEISIHDVTFDRLNSIRDLILESLFYAEPSMDPEAHTLNLAERARFKGQLDLLDMILTNCNILEN